MCETAPAGIPSSGLALPSYPHFPLVISLLLSTELLGGFTLMFNVASVLESSSGRTALLGILKIQRELYGKGKHLQRVALKTKGEIKFGTIKIKPPGFI